MIKPTRVDVLLVCTQDRGDIHDPILNQLRATMRVAMAKVLREHGLKGNISFHSEVTRHRTHVTDARGSMAIGYDY